MVTNSDNENDAAKSNGRSRRKAAVFCLLLGVAGSAVAIKAVIDGGARSRTVSRLIQESRAHLAEGRWSEAEQAARRAIELDPQAWPAVLACAEAQAHQGQLSAALESYDQIPANSELAFEARFAAGEMCLLQLRQLTAAETRFRGAHKLNRQDPRPLQHLAYILGIEGRIRELERVLLELIELNEFSNFHLYLLATSGHAPINPEQLPDFLEHDPDDPAVRAGMVRVLQYEDGSASVLTALEEIVAERPDLDSAQVMLGEQLLEAQDVSALIDWWRKLPEAVLEHSGVWRVRGHLHRMVGNEDAAIRCFWEAVSRNATDQEASYQLGLALSSQGDAPGAELFLEHSRNLQSYRSIVDVAKTGEDRDAIRETIDRAESLGMLWEAYGWSRMAARLEPPPAWVGECLERLQPGLVGLELTRVARDRNPAHRVDLTSYLLPESEGVAIPTGNAIVGSQPEPVRSTHVSFRNDASRVGIQFQYFNGGDPNTAGLQRMYEFTGGGVGIIDYDLDGWPDVYFTQGTTWPPEPGDGRWTDGFFRSLGGIEFEEVFEQAGLTDTGFGQGVAAGDVNEDGFPDLLIGNIGRNHLLVNNGDGTFHDATDILIDDPPRWTTSCMIADLNGDGFPDIYVVNYLTGNDVFDRVCRDHENVPRLTCHPYLFPAADDVVLFNSGNGTFQDATVESEMTAPQGRGMGIATIATDGNRLPILFVANDASPNSLFVPELDIADEHSRGVPRFRDRGLSRGVAVNSSGRSEACMGVATGDVNVDGLVDVFVTNFEGESNTLYTQQPGGLFLDETSRFGLDTPSVEMLGFGAQFLDADLDGFLDLVVANGHVNDLRNGDSRYRMLPQFFQNVQGRRFEEVAPDQLGDYFGNPHLGRSVALVDWNRDGGTDFIVSHLDAPAALVTNTTTTSGRFLRLKLVGRLGSRDAVGTVVEVRTPEGFRVQELSAGNGYQSSNERVLHFGLGQVDRIDSIRCRWASGKTEVFDSVELDTSVLIVEGTSQILQLP